MVDPLGIDKNNRGSNLTRKDLNMRVFPNVLLGLCAAALVTLGAQKAQASQFGFYYAMGLPYTTQYGLNYVTDSQKFSFDLSYNSFAVNLGLAKVSLTKPELNLKWHPFTGSFFLGLGLGQMSLNTTAVEPNTLAELTLALNATTISPNLGWMWGKANGGFWFGMDVGFQTASSGEPTIDTTIPTTSQTYIDALQSKDTYGKSMALMTFFKLGYLF